LILIFVCEKIIEKQTELRVFVGRICEIIKLSYYMLSAIVDPADRQACRLENYAEIHSSCGAIEETCRFLEKRSGVDVTDPLKPSHLF
jgi:hypothetical protein